MPRKIIVLFLFMSFLITQSVIYPSRTNAVGDSEIINMAAMLPESDAVVALDFERTLTVAGPGLLNGDAKKIEHLMNLMRTIENEIGISPAEIKQVAAGFKIPNTDSKDIFKDLEFTAIIRTANPNTNLLDNWSKRMDAIFKFKDEQAASRQYIEEFREFRDFKPEKATPEKIAEYTKKFQTSLTKTVQISAAADKLPKLASTVKPVADLKEQNKAVADSVNQYLTILKADTEMKTFRSTSIKLLNRWNAVTLDDPQRTSKLADILKESQAIYPEYRKKYINAVKVKALISILEPPPYAGETDETDFNKETDASLDKVIASLGNLPAARAAKAAELDALSTSLQNINSTLTDRLAMGEANAETVEDISEQTPVTPKSPNFQETFNKTKREENVNGKRMVIIDFEKLNPPKPVVNSNANVAVIRNSNTIGNAANMTIIRNSNAIGNVAVNTNSNVNISSNTNVNSMPKTDDPPKKPEMPNLAIGFLDDKTLAIGFEKNITAFLKRDPNYKNPKAAEMLSSAQNSLLAFAVNSKVFTQAAKDLPKPPVGNTGSDIFGKLLKDVNIHGSVNYDAAGATNDVSLSLGFTRSNVEEIISTEQANKETADNTFEVAGFQVGKDIFYDLLNSFKAVQGSLTFRFEKKKVAGLVRSTPRIIEKFVARSDQPKAENVRKKLAKKDQIKSVQDLFTTPQLYENLAELFKQ